MVEACLCNACGHVWLPKPENTNPISCARCKSPYWDKPRVRKTAKSEMKPDREIAPVIQEAANKTAHGKAYKIQLPDNNASLQHNVNEGQKQSKSKVVAE